MPGRCIHPASGQYGRTHACAPRPDCVSATWLHGGRIVTPTRVVDGGILLDGDTIVGVVDAAAPPPEVPQTLDLAGAFVLSGFIDLHVHGGGGATFDDGAEAIATGLASHRAQGTARSLVSLVTAPADDMVAAVGAAAEYAAADPTVLGLHLEGPFLSPQRRGVHDPRSLRTPDPTMLDRLIDAGRGTVRVVTVAPELPGGLDLIRQLGRAGVLAAVGHSDAGYDVALQAFRAGAGLVTHAFNGMAPLHHRDPGIIGAAMTAGVVLEVINDGFHLHAATVGLLDAIAPGRLALVTDAMGAAGAADGAYRLGAFDVEVRNGQARLADGTIAGSTLTMAAAVQRAVRDVGMSVLDVANAASLVPATVLGLADRYGSLQAGRAADLVVTDGELRVTGVMAGGTWVRRPGE